MKRYLLISGTIFGLVAVLHVLRLALDWPAQIGGWEVPFWVSWIGIAVPAMLCLWAYRLATGIRP
jgi:hypothetical protein